MIAVAWATGSKKSNSREIKIYNSTTGQINRLTWGMVEKYSIESLLKNPLENIFLIPNGHFTTFKSIKYVRHFFEELLPSYIMDFYLRLINKKPL